MDLISFFIFAAIAVLASLGVIAQRNVMHGVMLLIVSFGALAGLYILLDAPFSAVTQIIIYAGAIMVLFLFVVMLLNAHTEDDVTPLAVGPHALKLGALLSVLLGVEVAWGLSNIPLATFGSDPGLISKISSVTTIGQALFTTYSFAFEVTSILILVAMMGAVVIAGKPRRES
ncbi:MAG TPA: NADH-quinone oxidoreductase subunit J [Vicinamibacterales bacterium]|jgi:NADH-quinone oxidoreductase subunit J|nr:NADH-quinone oxidoreductase subunit J [Vicinamibacterales bacterium]